MSSEPREDLAELIASGVVTRPLPEPTQDLAQGLANINEFGFTIYPRALSDGMLARTRAALYREVERDRANGAHLPHPFDAEASTNTRVWNLPSKDRLFEAMATHPVALDYVKATIGWPARLSTLSGNINFPGSRACLFHADQIWAPEPWPQGPLGLNCGWLLDDFTPEKGSTRLLPGSHRLNRLPDPEDEAVALTAVDAPAGSLLIFESRLWHQTGDFSADSGQRAAIFAFYQKPLYVPAENWFLQTRQDVLLRASDELLTLLGFKDPYLGRED